MRYGELWVHLMFALDPLKFPDLLCNFIFDVKNEIFGTF